MPANKTRISKRHHATALLILNRLKKEALKVYLDSAGNEKPMTGNQITCAQNYMRKVLPDLRSVEVQAKVDSKIEVNIRRLDK